MKIMFLIRSLGYGGAERQLILLAKGLRTSGHEVAVATFYSGLELENELADAGIPIWTLGKRNRWDIASCALKLLRTIHKARPTILHSYLTTANLLALFAKLCFPSIKLVWGVRASDVEFASYDWFTRLSFRCECILSNVPDLIIANSYAGRDYHVRRGFPAKNMIVIHNGVDTDRFRPNEKARKKIRSQWGIQDCHTLIGVVGRLDPMKDHPTFLKASALLAHGRKDVRFVCVGDGPGRYRDGLYRLANELGLTSSLIWAGSWHDMPAVFNALDILVSSSCWGEGFPNVVVEAMACGVPCVVTDVGDSAYAIAELGTVVKAGDSTLLAQAIEAAIANMFGNGSDKIRIRGHVVNNFSAIRCVNQSQQLLDSLSH